MWKCSKCKETIEDSFDSCWNCGTGKDGTPAPADFGAEQEEEPPESEGASKKSSVSASAFGAAKRVVGASDVPEGRLNKVVRVTLKGGLLGMLSDDPHRTLSAAIARENQDGWKVVQVIPDDTGNLVIMIIRFVILMLTLLLYMPANGYWVVMEKVSPTKK